MGALGLIKSKAISILRPSTAIDMAASGSSDDVIAGMGDWRQGVMRVHYLGRCVWSNIQVRDDVLPPRRACSRVVLTAPLWGCCCDVLPSSAFLSRKRTIIKLTSFAPRATYSNLPPPPVLLLSASHGGATP